MEQDLMQGVTEEITKIPRKRNRSHRPRHSSYNPDLLPPTRAKLRANLRRLDELLGIDKTDYRGMGPQKLQRRIEARIEEQDSVICPQRSTEGEVTPELRGYMRKREQASKS